MLREWVDRVCVERVIDRVCIDRVYIEGVLRGWVDGVG